ncbi:hypothetical protein Hdeb2414_s0022g00611401 [Helianthus debilis subsp. tardiflorus]
MWHCSYARIEEGFFHTFLSHSLSSLIIHHIYVLYTLSLSLSLSQIVQIITLKP